VGNPVRADYYLVCDLAVPYVKLWIATPPIPPLPKPSMTLITFRLNQKKMIILTNEDNNLEKFNKIIRWIRAYVSGLPFGYDSFYPTPSLPTNPIRKRQRRQHTTSL
jgi:hypothetical protein